MPLAALRRAITGPVLASLSKTVPEPLGAMVMAPLLTLTNFLPLTSRSPPSCGVVSSTISSILSLFKFVKFASPSVQVSAEPLPALVTIVDM